VPTFVISRSCQRLREEAGPEGPRANVSPVGTTVEHSTFSRNRSAVPTFRGFRQRWHVGPTVKTLARGRHGRRGNVLGVRATLARRPGDANVGTALLIRILSGRRGNVFRADFARLDVPTFPVAVKSGPRANVLPEWSTLARRPGGTKTAHRRRGNVYGRCSIGPPWERSRAVFWGVRRGNVPGRSADPGAVRTFATCIFGGPTRERLASRWPNPVVLGNVTFLHRGGGSLKPWNPETRNPENLEHDNMKT